MVRRGDLNPVKGDDGELYFDAGEVSRVKRTIGGKIARLVPRI